MAIISNHVIILALLKTHAKYLAQRSHVQQVLIDGTSVPPTAAGPAGARNDAPRSSYGGQEQARVHAAMARGGEGALAAACGIEIVKLVASASKIQQPSNAAPWYRTETHAARLRRPSASRVSADILDLSTLGPHARFLPSWRPFLHRRARPSASATFKRGGGGLD